MKKTKDIRCVPDTQVQLKNNNIKKKKEQKKMLNWLLKHLEVFSGYEVLPCMKYTMFL